MSEFNRVWNQVQEHMSPRYNTGRGSKSPNKAKDLFFMSVCVLKHGSKWNLMAYLFEMKPETFEKRMTGMIAITSDFLYTRFVEPYTEKCDMQRLLAENHISNL